MTVPAEGKTYTLQPPEEDMPWAMRYAGATLGPLERVTENSAAGPVAYTEGNGHGMPNRMDLSWIYWDWLQPLPAAHAPASPCTCSSRELWLAGHQPECPAPRYKAPH